MNTSQRKKKYAVSFKIDTKGAKYEKLINYVNKQADDLDVKVMRRGLIIRSPSDDVIFRKESGSENKRHPTIVQVKIPNEMANYKAVVQALYNSERNETSAIEKTTSKALTEEEKQFYASF